MFGLFRKKPQPKPEPKPQRRLMGRFGYSHTREV
jgi:hypothetical protein